MDGDTGTTGDSGWAKPPEAAPPPGAPGQPPPAAQPTPVDLDHLAGGRVITVKGPLKYVVVPLLVAIVTVLFVGVWLLEWL